MGEEIVGNGSPVFRKLGGGWEAGASEDKVEIFDVRKSVYRVKNLDVCVLEVFFHGFAFDAVTQNGNSHSIIIS